MIDNLSIFKTLRGTPEFSCGTPRRHGTRLPYTGLTIKASEDKTSIQRHGSNLAVVSDDTSGSTIKPKIFSEANYRLPSINLSGLNESQEDSWSAFQIILFGDGNCPFRLNRTRCVANPQKESQSESKCWNNLCCVAFRRSQQAQVELVLTCSLITPYQFSMLGCVILAEEAFRLSGILEVSLWRFMNLEASQNQRNVQLIRWKKNKTNFKGVTVSFV